MHAQPGTHNIQSLNDLFQMLENLDRVSNRNFRILIQNSENRVLNRIQAVEDRIQAVEHRIQAVEDRIQAVDDRIQAVEHRIQAVDDRIQAVEHRTQCRIFNSRINDPRSEIEWPQNDQGIIFGRLPNGDPNPHVVAPDSIRGIRVANEAMLNAIMEHYRIRHRLDESLQRKREKIIGFLGMFPLYI